MQKQLSDVSSSSSLSLLLAVSVNAKSTAAITAVSVVLILPFDANSKNIINKNRYQLSSNILSSVCISQYARNIDKVTFSSRGSARYYFGMDFMIDNETAALVKAYVPRNATLFTISELFGACSDVTRTKIICALSISEMCVTDICGLLSLNQTTCSHQLRLLKSADIVKARRDGKIIYYSLKNEKIEDVLTAAVEFLNL